MTQNTLLADSVTHIVQYLSGTNDNQAIVDTPRRVLDFYEWFKQPKRPDMTTFANKGYDQMILVTDIPFYSLCEHHILPFFGTASVAYIPNSVIVGLSKIPRLLAYHSRRLQTQEFLTRAVAVDLEQILDAKGVAVSLSGRHMCMEMRGIQQPGLHTITTHISGLFKSEPKTRQEYFSSRTNIKT